jgi:hypothetical protein
MTNTHNTNTPADPDFDRYMEDTDDGEFNDYLEMIREEQARDRVLFTDRADLLHDQAMDHD